MAGGDFHWPKKGDTAFKPSLSPTDRSSLEAFVFPSAAAIYTVGFKRAADSVVEAAQHQDLNSDDLFRPTAYLYRHYLELMLKDLVRLGVRLNSIDKCDACGCLSSHDLHKLWKKVRKLIEGIWPDSDHGDLDAIERVILDEFHNVDKKGQAFRYASDKQGKPSSGNFPERVDLINLKVTMEKVANFLEAAEAGIDACDPGSP